jgi:hypothetical protein
MYFDVACVKLGGVPLAELRKALPSFVFCQMHLLDGAWATGDASKRQSIIQLDVQLLPYHGLA